MAVIISITNQKGGTGKTTTAAALLSGLTRRKYRTLAIDLDAQSNLSYMTGAETGGRSSAGLITGEGTAAEAIQHTPQGDVIPAAKILHLADTLVTDIGKEYRLREALESVADDYDYIILDTPPHFGTVTINAITAAHKVIIPAQADIFSLQGIHEIAESIAPVKKYCNPQLTIDGILMTRYSPRTVISRDLTTLAESLAERIGTRIYNAKIREAVAVREAAAIRKSIFDYAPKSAVATDYLSFIDEFTISTGTEGAAEYDEH